MSILVHLPTSFLVKPSLVKFYPACAKSCQCLIKVAGVQLGSTNSVHCRYRDSN